MSDYRTIDKTDWFIQRMISGWFSRPEIVELAESEFAGIYRKTLDGTIGQYWSDSVNPKWGTCKAIQSRGLKIIESRGDDTSYPLTSFQFHLHRLSKRRIQEEGKPPQPTKPQLHTDMGVLGVYGVAMIASFGRRPWHDTGPL